MFFNLVSENKIKQQTLDASLNLSKIQPGKKGIEIEAIKKAPLTNISFDHILIKALQINTNIEGLGPQYY